MSETATKIERTTVFDSERKYRFTLWREWDQDLLTGCADDLPNIDKYVQFIGLNPSTADEKINDRTIRRCIGFAQSWGYGALCMTNIFPFRATDPVDMMSNQEPDAMRIENANWVVKIAKSAGLIVCAWGKDGSYLNRANKFLKHFREVEKLKLHHLGLNSDGSPKHPLYLSKTLKPIPW